MKKTFLIIDAFGILYRYYFIFLKNPLLNSKGFNVSSINGFLRTYFSLIETYPTDYIALALDSSKKTFRNEIYKEYKENRSSMPDDLRAQIPVLYELIDALGIPRLLLDNYEADDIIGLIAKNNNENDIKTIIYSPDKDILQLVNENTNVVISSRDGELILYDKDVVKAKKGVYPNQIVDLLALMGDASDNIPGVKGVGEKTALKLLDEYQSLDGIYENIEAIQGKLKEKLSESKDNAYMSYKLATIETNVPIELNYEAYEKHIIKHDEVKKILDDLELNQIRNKVNAYIGGNMSPKEIQESRVKVSTEIPKPTPVNYYLIENDKELTNLIADIKAKKLVCVDFETTGLSHIDDRIIGISFALKPNEAFYLDLSGRTKIDLEASSNLVFDTLKDESIKIIGHNLKYEYKMIKSINKVFGNIYFDTMIAAYLVNPTGFSFSMDNLALDYLHYNTMKYADITDNAKKTLLDVDIKDVVNYACEDADITFRLYEYLKPIIESKELTHLFYNIEMPLLSVLGEMECRGVHISKEAFKTLSDSYATLLEKTQKNIYAESKSEFNIQSPKQTGDILFHQMGIAPLKKTKTGQFSTDDEVLNTLAKKYKIAEYLLTYRKYSKLKNTYLDALPNLVHDKTGRIHASFNQTVTATGRLSSSEPNLQNIPARGEEGRNVRNAFTAEAGNVLISADYSQIELRLLAHFSEDPELLKAFRNNEDIHKKTAMKIYSVSEAHVTSTMRNTAKIINFSIIYGKTAFGLSKELNISRKEAEDFIKNYFKTYAGVEPFCANVINKTRETGIVKTITGRIRDLSKTINSQNTVVRNEADRIAVNTVIQGSAADLIKVAMVKMSAELKKNTQTAKMVMQVHDELVVEVREDESEKTVSIMKEVMENALSFSVPILVSINAGKNWGEVH